MAKINKWSQRPLMVWVQKPLPYGKGKQQPNSRSASVHTASIAGIDCPPTPAKTPATATSNAGTAQNTNGANNAHRGQNETA